MIKLTERGMNACLLQEYHFFDINILVRLYRFHILDSWFPRIDFTVTFDSNSQDQ